MNQPLAFRGTYSDWRLVKTRGVVQVILEIPLADADMAYQILGGMPDSSKERWFGIAPLSQKEPKPDKRDWRDLPPAQQAGIRCEEPAFISFLKEERPDDWHETNNAPDCVRLICAVKSRSELGTNHIARVIWTQLNAAFEAWKVAEHA